jgi:hypothetical protein
MATATVLSQVDATLIAASIGASVSLALWILRDVLLEGRKERRRRRRELVERKLTEIYSPLWVAFGGRDGSLPNILNHREIRTQIGAHFHLLSPELQDILGRVLLLGRFQDGTLSYTVTDGERLIEANPPFVAALEADLKRLQEEFNRN